VASIHTPLNSSPQPKPPLKFQFWKLCWKTTSSLRTCIVQFLMSSNDVRRKPQLITRSGEEVIKLCRPVPDDPFRLRNDHARPLVAVCRRGVGNRPGHPQQTPPHPPDFHLRQPCLTTTKLPALLVVWFLKIPQTLLDAHARPIPETRRHEGEAGE